MSDLNTEDQAAVNEMTGQVKKLVGDGESVEFRDNSDLVEGEKLAGAREQTKAMCRGRLPFFRIRIKQQGSI